MRKFLLSTAASIVLVSLAQAQSPFNNPPDWDVGQLKCSDIIEQSGPKPASLFYFYWLNGYINGLKGASVLDKRLEAASYFKEEELRAAVLTICSKKPDMPVLQATVGVVEMAINVSGPGKTGEPIDLLCDGCDMRNWQ